MLHYYLSVGGADAINCLGHDMNELTAKEEAFAQAYVLGGCSDATAAWRIAHPDSKAKPETQHQKACRMHAQDNVKARISELKKKAAVKAEEKFTVSVEQRLRWLEEVATAGLSMYQDSNGQRRRENLAATRAAVQTLNEMLGIADGEGDDKAAPLEIKFSISQPKGRIVTTNVDVNDDD